ncbi:MAG: hypothetical protein M1822_010167 [Bathelium mastoideum]|nr:MAG: hypothetical protein M1822_010167 [Bathelium mastoideum]
MAFSNGFADRSDDLRFRSPQSPNEDSPLTYSSPLSPGRGAFPAKIHTQMQSQAPSANDARTNLHRRFTMNALPTLSPIGQQRRLAAEAQDHTTTLEKKKLEHEYLREQRRRFEAEMALLDLQQKHGEDEIQRLSDSIGHGGLGGRQSEPTTPPEYRENGLTSAYPRSNRYSTSSVNSIGSPPGLTRPGRAGSQMTSPPSDHSRPFHHHTSSNLPSRSVPGSRRHSDEEDEEEDWSRDVTEFDHRSAAVLNRNSMPATGRGRDMPDLASVLQHLPKDLLGDEDEKQATQAPQNSLTSPTRNTFFQMGKSDDPFPVLLRSEGSSGVQLGNMATSGPQASDSSAALDLAQSPVTETETGSSANTWSSFGRHQRSQPSLPMNTMRPMSQQFDDYSSSQISSGAQTPTKPAAPNRHSIGATYTPYSEIKRTGLFTSPTNQTSVPTPPKLQSSYSTNDIPTMKTTGGMNGSLTSPTAAPKTHAEQHFQNHNATLGRFPAGAMKRHSRDLSGGDTRIEDQATTIRPLTSVLHANAAPFGPTMNATVAETDDQQQTAAGAPVSPSFASFQSQQQMYNGYNLPLIQSMNALNLGTQPSWQTPVPVYQPAFSLYQQYGQYNQQQRVADSQARVIQARRAQNGEGSALFTRQNCQADSSIEHARFSNIELEQIKGEIYSLCKDQHGCRYLQKQLEDRDPERIQMIFAETSDHVVELMTDPFGNYLCQKLLEYTTDDQRTVLIRNAAPRMHIIAINQHGTRALQKMIEFISSPEQINMIMKALHDQVVPLIQDLNGNHVIQKCLNHLSSDDAQFIFSAVGANCIIVGTHRHGCCVLQRCIDHASGHQKAQLVRQITNNAHTLVQDPFGNYVVQYILDLGEQAFSLPLCRSFLGEVANLSKQKFSSNVIEKCIRTTDPDTKQLMIEELMATNELERLLRDSFANYVVQTAMEYADPETKGRLVDAIRPHLTNIKSTPHGKRIAAKIADRDGRLSGDSSGHNTPHDISSTGQLPASSQFGSVARRHGNDHAYRTAMNSFSNMSGGFANPHRVSAASSSGYSQNAFPGGPVQQSFGTFGRPSAPQQTQQQYAPAFF